MAVQLRANKSGCLTSFWLFASSKSRRSPKTNTIDELSLSLSVDSLFLFVANANGKLLISIFMRYRVEAWEFSLYGGAML